MALINAPIPGGTGTSGYAGAALLAHTAYKAALVRNNQKTLSSLRNFGYEADVDPTTGSLQNLRTSANNPGGVYQQMLRSHAQRDQADREDAAGRGIYGGLAEQQRSNDRFGYAADASQLGQQLTGSMDQYAQDNQDASYTQDAALYQAEEAARQEAYNNQNFTGADFSGAQYPDYGNTDFPPPDEPITDPGAGPHIGPTTRPTTQKLTIYQKALKAAGVPVNRLGTVDQGIGSAILQAHPALVQKAIKSAQAKAKPSKGNSKAKNA